MIKKEIQESLEIAFKILDEAFSTDGFSTKGFNTGDFGGAKFDHERFEAEMNDIINDLFENLNNAKNQYKQASSQGADPGTLNNLKEKIRKIGAMIVQKKALLGKVGAGVAAAGAVAYGGKKLYDRHRLNKAVRRHR